MLTLSGGAVATQLPGAAALTPLNDDAKHSANRAVRTLVVSGRRLVHPMICFAQTMVGQSLIALLASDQLGDAQDAIVWYLRLGHHHQVAQASA
jgi:hypothetical protein